MFIGLVSDEVVDLAAVRERAEVALTVKVVRWYAQGEWRAHGARQPADWLARAAGLGREDAHRLLRRVRVLHRVGRLGDVFTEGAVTVANADLLARAVNRSRLAAARRDQELLARAAAGMGADRFGRFLARWTRRVDQRNCRVPVAPTWRSSPAR